MRRLRSLKSEAQRLQERAEVNAIMAERAAAEIEEEEKPGIDHWDQQSPWAALCGAATARNYVRPIRRCE